MSEELNTNELTKDDVIANGIDCHNEKKYYSKEMNTSAKLCSEETGIERRAIMMVKDYIHYKGRGWGDTCLTKSEEKDKYPDRVAPTFRRLLDIVSNCYALGKEDLLSEYINALEDAGIKLVIDESKFLHPDEETVETADRYLQAMETFQCSICEQNDYMTEVLAEQAEAVDLSPKNKYKQIIQLAAKKLEGKDINDKVHDEYEKAGLFINGLAKVSEMDLSMPEPEV